MYAIHVVFAVLVAVTGIDGMTTRDVAPNVPQKSMPASLLPFTIQHVSAAIHSTISLCELLKPVTIAGLYTVLEIGTKAESVSDAAFGTVIAPFVYVKFERKEGWSLGAPKILVARMPGGPLPMSKLIRSPEAKVTVGETVGYLGWVSAANAGYAVLDDFLLLRSPAPGKWVHSQFFHGPMWTKDAVSWTMSVNLAAQPACPLEVESDSVGAGPGKKAGGK